MPASLHLALITEAPLPLRSALRDLFNPIFRTIQKALKKSARENCDWLEESLAGARLRLLHLDDAINNPAPPSTKRQIGRIKYDAKLAALMNEFDDRDLRKQAEAERDNARRQLIAAEFHAHPDIMINELTAREMLVSSGVSPDGALLNLSTEGLTLKSLTAVGGRDTLEQIARLYRSAWAGMPGPHASCPRPSAELLSNLWVATPNQWSTAAKLRAVVEAGVFSHFVVLRTEDLQFRTTPAEPVDDAGWFREINYLYNCRRAGDEVAHALDAWAEERYLRFAGEINDALPGLPMEAQSFASLLPALAVKLGLLLHLGAHDAIQPKPVKDDDGFMETPPPVAPEILIPDAIFALAVQLTCHVAREQLALICPTDVSEKHAGCDDRQAHDMASRLHRYGPLRKRLLFRHYSKQSYARLDPILNRAIEMGLIACRGKIYSTVNGAVSAQVSASAVSTASVTADGPVPSSKESN